MIYVLLERGEGREEERNIKCVRDTSIGCLSHDPAGTCPTTQARAPTDTGELSVCGTALSPLNRQAGQVQSTLRSEPSVAFFKMHTFQHSPNSHSSALRTLFVRDCHSCFLFPLVRVTHTRPQCRLRGCEESEWHRGHLFLQMKRQH